MISLRFLVDAHVDDRPLENLSEGGVGAKDEYAGPGRDQLLLLLSDAGHLV